MLNFQEFQKYVQLNLNKVLPNEYKNASVLLNEVTKNNGIVLHAVTVKLDDSKVAPIIYLEDYFKKYEAGSAELDTIMREIGRVATDNVLGKFEFIAQDFQNFDFVKDKIIMVAINAERNLELLSSVPHQRKEDLALIYKIMLGNCEYGIATITIKNEYMSMWNATTATIHDLARKNTRKLFPITIQSMGEITKEILSEDCIPNNIREKISSDTLANHQMYVISNSARLNGAVSIFYEDVLLELANKIGTNDILILPSSVHECIAIPATMGTPASLVAMVREVNETQVDLEEQLSNHVYRFDAKTKTFFIADTHI